MTLLIIGALLAAASYFIYKKLNPPSLPPYLIEGTGNIDGYIIRLNTKYPARVKSVKVEDGMRISKGDLVALLDSGETVAQKKEIEASIEAKKDEIEAQKIELEIAKESLPQKVKKASAAKKAAQAALEGIGKKIDSLKALVNQDKKDYLRLKNLYSQNLIDKQSLEKAKLKLTTDMKTLEELKAKQKELLFAISSANSTLKEAKSALKKIDSLKASIKALESSLKVLEAKKERIKTVLREFKIVSPIDGYVIERVAQPGEVLGSGMTVATLIDPDTLYLKIFVDTIENGKIKIGDKAAIFLDAAPDAPIEARVVKIAQKAEFTPKEVAVRSDRIQRVFAVHLKPLRPQPLLKLGIPAVGVIATRNAHLPSSLEEIGGL